MLWMTKRASLWIRSPVRDFSCDSGGDVHRRHEVTGWEHDVFLLFWPHLSSRCALSCRGCSACASGSACLRFSCARPLSTTPSSSTLVWGPGEPPSTWSVSLLQPSLVTKGFHLQQAGFKWPTVWIVRHLYKTLFKVNQGIISISYIGNQLISRPFAQQPWRRCPYFYRGAWRQTMRVFVLLLWRSQMIFMQRCFLWNWSMQLSQWKIALNRIWPFPRGSTFCFHQADVSSGYGK